MKLYLLIGFLFFCFTSFAQNVGVGNTSPAEKLDVSGNIKADTAKINVLKMTLNAGAGKVLSSNFTGEGGWTSSSTLPGSISSTGYLVGQCTSATPTAGSVWEFFTPLATVSLNGNQRVVMNIVASLGRNAAGSTVFWLDVGYKALPSGAIVNNAGPNYVEVQPIFPATTTKTTYSMTGTFKPVAGTYQIGGVVNCFTAGYLNHNDWMNAYYMIINE